MIPVLIGAGILLGAVVLVSNWDSLIKKFLDFLPRVKAFWQSIREYVPHAARMIGDTILEAGEMLATIAYQMYYKDDGKWMEKTTTYKVDINEVPEDIRSKIEHSHDKVDITPEMERELNLEI